MFMAFLFLFVISTISLLFWSSYTIGAAHHSIFWGAGAFVLNVVLSVFIGSTPVRGMTEGSWVGLGYAFVVSIILSFALRGLLIW
jgi:hypothetical protein